MESTHTSRSCVWKIAIVTALVFFMSGSESILASAVATDGSIITPSSGGMLVTSAGAWTFGSESVSYPEDWFIQLNGTGIGEGMELEVANGGQMYMTDEPGSWWVWENNGWVATTNPGSGSSDSNCGAAPLGDAAADVAAAGLNTCAMYSDWTYGIPNTVGTGLPSNWLDCSQNGGDNPNALWTWGMDWINYAGQNLPCTPNGNSSNSTIFMDTDNSGNPALHISVSQNTLNSMGNPEWSLSTGPYTLDEPSDNTHLGTPASWNFPLGSYIEMSYMNTGSNISSYANEISFWTFNASAYGDGPNCGNLELDFDETISLPGTATTTTHNEGCAGNYQIGPTDYYFTLLDYTTYGYLVTNDGNDNVSTCVYVNGSRQFCQDMTTADSQGLIYGRMPVWWMGAWNCNGECSGPNDTWIQYIKVYTCSNWLEQGNPAASSCSGTTYNGNFYVP